jgi:DNA repair photolyase
MKPIYQPSGKAKEYGDYAINIYTGCPHSCFYCFAPNVLHKNATTFHACVEPRKDIVEEVKKQVERENITGKLIHLCFTCDPYPKGYNTTPTREIIKILKSSGNNVQLLTKNGAEAMRDFDLLDENDWFGITYAGYENKVSDLNYIPVQEPNSGSPHFRLYALKMAKGLGINTWVSAEPVLNSENVLEFIDFAEDYVDLWKVGKLNYHKSNVDWKDFGRKVELLLKSKVKIQSYKGHEVNYYIKESLRTEMDT